MSEEKTDNKLNIELTEEIADGTYSNLAIISHSNSEFVIDFIRVMPGMPKAKVKSRILMTPEHAKRLMLAIEDNIQKYEANNGKIKDLGPGQQGGITMNFGGPTAEALFYILLDSAHKKYLEKEANLASFFLYIYR
jgi:hypothetical protein